MVDVVTGSSAKVGRCGEGVIRHDGLVVFGWGGVVGFRGVVKFFFDFHFFI